MARYEHLIQSLRDYFEHGLQPGGFLTAVLSNDLIGACSRADVESAKLLWHIAYWCYNNLPSGCYGSHQNVIAWCEMESERRKRVFDAYMHQHEEVHPPEFQRGEPRRDLTPALESLADAHRTLTDVDAGAGSHRSIATCECHIAMLYRRVKEER